jgi:tetratricopeptide (TPR) repeat protein
MHRNIVLSGLIFCAVLLIFAYRPVRNFIGALLVPVGSEGINIITLELAILKNPNDASAYQGRGYLYSQGVDSQAAIEDFTKVISINSKDPNQPSAADGHRKRGDVYRVLRDYERAVLDYQKAAELYQEKEDQHGYQFTIDLIKSIESMNNQSPKR